MTKPAARERGATRRAEDRAVACRAPVRNPAGRASSGRAASRLAPRRAGRGARGVPSSSSIPARASVPICLSRAPPRADDDALLAAAVRGGWSRRSPVQLRPRPRAGVISSTVTAIECGSSSRTPSSAASRISSAIRVSTSLSVLHVVRVEQRTFGQLATSRSASTSTWSPATRRHRHDVGELAQLRRPRPTARRPAAGDAVSVLVTIATTGARSCGQLGGDEPVAGADLLVGRHAEPDDVDVGQRGPHDVVEPLARAACAAGAGRACRRGSSWASGRVTMPRTACRVVCGLSLVITILLPTRALVSVDLPAFGRPTKQQKPDRKLTRPWSQTARPTRPGSDQ